MLSIRGLAIFAVACAACAALLPCAKAQAAAPSYLVLRRAEAPGRHYAPGYPDAALYEARTRGYAYGWFGAAPRTHASRHFGYYRTYTQWSWR